MSVSSVDAMGPVVIHTGGSSSPKIQPPPAVALPQVFRFLSPQDVLQMSSVGRQWQRGVLAATTPSCGSKHDNLLRVKAALPAEIASVPPFFGFTDAQIKTLLSPETKALWQEVRDAHQKPVLIRDWGELESRKECLERLQKSVEKDILSAELPLSDAQRRKLASFQGKTLIIRSSSNEDDVSSGGVNAGGNESVAGVAATEADLKRALAKVIASYFGYRSLNNRSAFENPFLEMPSCSALVMEQITEAGNEVSCVSGVMMTHKTAWFPQREGTVPHIVASFGFGGGVVSGRVPSDEWVLTKDQPYVTIRHKSHRMVSLPSGETRGVVNPPALQDSPCLTEAQLKRLQTAGRCLQEYFRKPMDVEFVFRGEELFIVQAREIRAKGMKDPTFLDPAAIPKTVMCFQGIPVVPGMGQVLTLPWYQACFAKDLEEADENYLPNLHKTVLIETPPVARNTHAEVNFSSQRPPVPCLLLSPDASHMCRQETLHLCLQTGLVAVTKDGGMDLPVRKGLFLHPAHLQISVDGGMPPVQGAGSLPSRIERLRSLLTATAEQLASRLNEVQGELDHFFTDISSRTAAQTGRYQQVARHLHELCGGVLCAMRRAATEKRPMCLAFHAGALRQLLQQTGRQIVGAHSLAGLEEATQLPAPVEAFLKVPGQAPILCELALFAKKAWEPSVQSRWLTFLGNNRGEAGAEALLARLKELDLLGMVPLWFAIHFSGEELPVLEVLLAQEPGAHEFLHQCLDFALQWRQLTERVERIDSVIELKNTWETLQKQSEAFLAFCRQFPKRDLLQTLQLSGLSYTLIQLWDAQIKAVKTSRLLPEPETKSVYGQRITSFAIFGLAAIDSFAIAVDTPHRDEFIKVLQASRKLDHPSSGGRPFSVQHCIVPRSQVYIPVTGDDERFTVIHQNLLRASSPAFNDRLLQLVPSTLSQAVRTFQTCAMTQAKRFAADEGTFISVQEESASVTINIPLNYHSFVITIRKNRGSETMEMDAYWKGSDNYQGGHFEFIQLLTAMAGIALKSYSTKGADLHVVFMAANTEQISLISRAIGSINLGSLTTRVDYEDLVSLLHPRKITGKTREQRHEEMEETRERINEFLWKLFVETGKAPHFCWMEYLFDRSYLEKKGLLSTVVARVLEEVEGRRPGSAYSKVFFNTVLETFSQEAQKELLWRALTADTERYYRIPASFKEELLIRLYREAPAHALRHFGNHYESVRDFKELMDVMVADGGPTSQDGAKFFYYCYKQLEGRGEAPESWTRVLQSWDAQFALQAGVSRKEQDQ